MARPRATPEQRADERRRLRQAASELYQEGGARAITVRSVTKRAGVSSGALYNAFSGGLPELMRSLWVGPVIEAGRRLQEVADATSDPVERIRAILHGFVEFVLANPDVHRNVLLYVRPAARPAPEPQPVDDVAMFALLHAAIVDGQRDGSIRSGDPARLAELLWAGVHGALALAINSEIYALTPGDELAPDMIDLLVGSLAPGASSQDGG